MSEMLHIQIGQAGNRISSQFWKQLLKQHGLDHSGKLKEARADQTQNVRSFFYEQSQNIYMPRMLSIDLDVSTMQQAFTSSLSNNYQLQNFIYSSQNSRNLFPTVYLKHGVALMNSIQDCIKTNIQKCDNFAGCLLSASISGGTGSGMASLICQKLQQMFGNRIIMPTILAPSPNISNIVVQDYNASLSLAKIGESTASILFQNQAILNAKSTNKITDLNGVNRVIAKCLSNLTSSFRFACDSNFTLRKMASNMILYPRLNYLYMGLPYSYDPHENIGMAIKRNLLSSSNASLTLHKKPYSSELNPNKWICNYFIFRSSRHESYHLNYTISKAFQSKIRYRYRYQQFKEVYFYKSVNPNFILAAVDKKVKEDGISMSCVQNRSQISQLFLRISDSVQKMKRKKAYLHWYLQEGMELDDINHVYISLADTRSSYQELIEPIHGCSGEEGYDSSYEDYQ